MVKKFINKVREFLIKMWGQHAYIQSKKKYMAKVMSYTSMKRLQASTYKNSVNHGWWSPEPSFGELISLCHAELSEALEEYRVGSPWTYNLHNGKPCGIASELADTVILIMNMCEHHGVDLEEAIIEKHEYNITRSHRHGGKRL